MLTLLAFTINILLNPLICKIKQFFCQKITWTDKIYSILSVLIKGNSETLICEETFLHKSISKYVRLRYRILRYIYSLLHHCTAANLDQISLRYFQYQFFSSGHFSLDSVYILCLFSRSYCLIIDVFTFT